METEVLHKQLPPCHRHRETKTHYLLFSELAKEPRNFRLQAAGPPKRLSHSSQAQARGLPGGLGAAPPPLLLLLLRGAHSRPAGAGAPPPPLPPPPPRHGSCASAHHPLMPSLAVRQSAPLPAHPSPAPGPAAPRRPARRMLPAVRSGPGGPLGRARGWDGARHHRHRYCHPRLASERQPILGQQ